MNEVCTVSTMVTCGVCPGAKCVARSTLGLPPITTTEPTATSSGGSGPLIGGIVGGILGAGLLFCGGGYILYRHRKKKNTLPLAFRSPNQLHHLERTIPATVMDEEMQERMSGVIPVTFIPPSRPHSSMTNTSNAPSRYTYTSQLTQDDNPFKDRPISEAQSIMTTTTQNYSRRGSMESTISHHQVATVVQATQMTRAKPTIMRVNTVKPANGVQRTGSLKTIQPEIQPPAALDNPFDDKNKVEPERKVTDSVVSAPGDGEITIFWNGS